MHIHIIDDRGGRTMRLDKIDLNLFVVLDAVYRERNVTRVAERLNLTQPAVSNALGRLRQTLDDPLFIRTPSGMQPTPVADSVIGDVRRALGLLRDSASVNARFEPATSQKTFRLGMNELAQLLALPHLQACFEQLAPMATLQCYYVDRTAAVEDLKSGALDLLLETPQVNARELSHLPLGELHYRVAMRVGHPLAPGPISLEDYLRARHLLVSGRRRGRGQADVALNNLGHSRSIALRLQGYSVAAAATAAGDLLWTAPEAMARQRGLHVTALPFACEPLSFNLYWPREADRDPASRWLRERVEDAFTRGLSTAVPATT